MIRIASRTCRTDWYKRATAMLLCGPSRGGNQGQAGRTGGPIVLLDRPFVLAGLTVLSNRHFQLHFHCREMHNPDRFIASCASWDDFFERARQLLAKGEQGAAFERLTQLYLQTTPEYRTALEHVWMLRDVPPDVRGQLNLPGLDEGIDLVARTRHREYWAIQAKFRSQRDKPLTRTALGTFSSLAFNTCNNIALAVVAHTSTKPISKRRLLRNTVEIGLDRWRSLDNEDQKDWKLIVARLKGRGA